MIENRSFLPRKSSSRFDNYVPKITRRSMIMGTAVLGADILFGPRIAEGRYSKEELERCYGEYSYSTWKGIEGLGNTNTGFPADIGVIGRDEKNQPRMELSDIKTSPTNMGLYLASLACARDLKYCSEESLTKSVKTILDSLGKVETHMGMYFNWYDCNSGNKLTGYDNSNLISTVDNAWLATGLIVTQRAFSEHSDSAASLLAKMEMERLYDSKKNKFFGGFDVEKNEPVDWHYGALISEARMANYVGVPEFAITEESYNSLGRFSADDVKNMKKFVEINGNIMRTPYTEDNRVIVVGTALYLRL